MAAVAAALLLIGACHDAAQDLDPRGTLADSLGVALWVIPGIELPAAMRLERRFGFEMPDTGWAVWPDGIAISPADERIYVLDESTPRVLVFDLAGQLQGEVGRRGQGPGEYDAPTALSLDTNGDLLVMDPGVGFVHRWSGDMEYVARQPIAPSYWGPGFAVTPRGLWYTTAGGVESGTMTESLVSVTSAGVDTLSTVESKWTPIEMPCGRMPVPEVFSRTAVWGASSDYIAFSAVPRYEVTLRRDDSTVAVFRMGRPPSPRTAMDAEASVPLGPLQFLVEGCGMTPARVVRDAGFVSEVSPVFLLTIDPNSRVWAARGAAPVIEGIDVFDPIQGFVGSIESTAFPVAFLDESSYVAIRDTEWGSVLEVWQIVDSD
jgi:hypothetical protein